MAEFKTVMGERKRMCKQIGDCGKCPLGFRNNKTKMLCNTFILEFSEKAEKIIMDWAEKHPVLTNSKKFKEVFGKDLFKLCVEEPWGDVLTWLDEEYKEGEQHG